MTLRELHAEAFEALAPFPTVDDAYWAANPEPPTCRLCDGLGHGYPGAGPCPLEMRGAA